MPGVVLRELKDRSRGGEKGWYEGGGSSASGTGAQRRTGEKGSAVKMQGTPPENQKGMPQRVSNNQKLACCVFI